MSQAPTFLLSRPPVLQRSSIRPFPSSLITHFQNEAKCKTFLVKMSFICIRIKNQFHINSFALSLALKQRLGANWRYPDQMIIHGVCILSSASGTKSETQTTLVSTRPVDTRRIEEIGEKIVVKDSSADVEAIQDILMEMADMRYPVYPSLRSIK